MLVILVVVVNLASLLILAILVILMNLVTLVKLAVLVTKYQDNEWHEPEGKMLIYALTLILYCELEVRVGGGMGHLKRG